MARILAYTSPARGHLFPLTPILDELSRRGHEISLRTLAAEADTMRVRGFDTHPIDPQIEAIEHDDWRGRSQRESLARVMRAFGARAQVEVPDLRRAVADERPDAILVDINCWGAQAAAAASGRPWATFCPYPIPLPSPDAPPYGPGFAPARGLLGRLRDVLVGPIVTGTYERAALPAMNAPRSGLGLPPFRDVREWLDSPPVVLYQTAEPFEYPHREWPDNIVMVGPCDWSPDVGSPQWLDELRQPVVLVTTSSEFQNDGHLVRIALEALAGEPFTVVATLPASDIGDARVPANARVERYVPHAPLLDRAVCAITHAGMGVTQRALARGVPVCAVPFARDQFEVARRVEVARAGTRLPAKRLRPDRLREAVYGAIQRRDGAARIAEALAAAGGPSAAADAVETRVLSSR
jgi:UDP:flavonoid glycosyltransferase YjiC (YdhE family)